MSTFTIDVIYVSCFFKLRFYSYSNYVVLDFAKILIEVLLILWILSLEFRFVLLKLSLFKRSLIWLSIFVKTIISKCQFILLSSSRKKNIWTRKIIYLFRLNYFGRWNFIFSAIDFRKRELKLGGVLYE